MPGTGGQLLSSNFHPPPSLAMAVDTERFQQAAARAAATVRSLPRGAHWLLACDNDADGLCAAAAMAQALLRTGHRFTIRASRDKTEAHYRALFTEPWDGLMLLDKGTSHLAVLSSLAQTGRPVVVVDHHNQHGPVPSNVTLLNPRAEHLDGSRDASGATTAVALALALCGEPALAWGPIGLAGAVGDWQHMGGWQGWNLELLQRCRTAGHIRQVPMPPLFGMDLADALVREHAPGAATPAQARGLLEAAGVDPDREVDELDEEGRTRLVSALVAAHLAAGLPPPPPQALVVPVDFSARLGKSLRQLFRVVDACGRAGAAATALAFLMGDAASSAEAHALFAAYRSALLEGVRGLRDGGTVPRAAFQVAWTRSPEHTGMVAGIGMAHVVDPRLPLAILAHRPDGLVQVSTRGTHEQVAAGLDLGAACHAAAQAVGSEGGGHPVAAGAVVPEGKVEAFLAALDAALAAQAKAAA
ncbi:MAG: single-stranded-DNA-specific exonuclease [Thermoplasmata archaeon]|jgi:RecJ-like exonuclease|nr:single-stranded-DNA-specific exonuclease [Thermoplasmata archaeon]